MDWHLGREAGYFREQRYAEQRGIGGGFCINEVGEGTAMLTHADDAGERVIQGINGYWRQLTTEVWGCRNLGMQE
jgi:hypothetical protein